MKAAMFVFLLLVCGTITRAQSSSTPASDVTLRMSAGAPDYCLGLVGNSFFTGPLAPDTITLRLPLKLRYETQRYEKVVVSGAHGFVMKVALPGQDGFTVLRQGGGGTTDVNSSSFYTIPVERAASATGPDLLQCLTATSPGCYGDFVMLPVLNRSTGVDLRGKTVQFVTTRDHTLPPDMVTKLKEKLKDSGTVFSGVVESETVTFRIPDEPLTKSCATPLPAVNRP
jgi:hypothetical protein